MNKTKSLNGYEPDTRGRRNTEQGLPYMRNYITYHPGTFGYKELQTREKQDVYSGSHELFTSIAEA